MCGEQCIYNVTVIQVVGSSPRVRGAVVPPFFGAFPLGIIPACAGSSKSRSQYRKPFRDHPRVCGEQNESATEKGVVKGSSPRVRGAVVGELLQHAERGIIPACAGSSRGRSRSGSPDRDHPRVCGEQSGSASSIIWRMGSSPRVRGADLKIPAQNTLSF